jgi:DNA polymerase-1
MSENKKLYLFDSFALIFRAYFAMSKNPLVNSKGQNTSTIQGFINTFTEIIKKYKPTHVAFGMDSPVITDRQAVHEFYKAHREEAPEDLKLSIPYIKEIIKGFNYPILEVNGYEADDLIGTIAKQAAKQGFEVYMVTSDKDFGQLVEEKIFMHKPPYMGKGHEILGVPEILEKWEIDHPDKVIDILGLMGDSADNIPGIKGVGEKTAKKLIQEFHSVEGVLENVDKLKGSLKEKVEQGKEMAIISKQLATILLDAPIQFDEAEYIIKEPNREKLEAIFSDLEFKTLGKRLLGDNYNQAPSLATIATRKNEGQISLFDDAEVGIEVENKLLKNHTNVEHQYHLVEGEEQINQLVSKLVLAPKICFDTETTGIDANNCELVGVSFSIKTGEAYYIPIPTDEKEAKDILEMLKPILENEKIIKIGQNLKYDILVLKWYGIEIKGILFDTMLAHYCLESEGRHNMNFLSENYLGYSPISIEELIGKKGKGQGNMRTVEKQKVAEYAGEDADITLQLEEVFRPKIEGQKISNIFYKVENPLIPALVDMEFEGVNIDRNFLNNFSNELGEDLKRISDTIFGMAGISFNLDSPKQLGDVLFKHLKIPVQDKTAKGGQASTNEETLSKLENEYPIASQILDYRELTKLKSTYIDAIPNLINPKTGRVHTTFNQTIASTGRLSSTNPNLQNIPIRTDRGKRTRMAFIPRNDDYTLLSADYSQIELRIVASVAKDEKMMEAFQNGHDIHTATAANVYQIPIEKVDGEMRRKAKMVNFGIIYGISAFGLAQRLNIPKAEASHLINQYFEEYKGIKKYMEDSINFAKQNGFAETIMGRRRFLRDINSRNFTIRSFAERNAINMPIQGSAADMIKLAMIDIHKELKDKGLLTKMTLQVHDELIFDVYKPELKEVENLVLNKMQNALPLNVPIEVGMGVGNNWLEAH